jgi:hypothetical protein
MAGRFWEQQLGEGPMLAAAVHHGHELREEVEAVMALDPASRLREEDPFTGEWTAMAPNRVVVHRSRFEIDLNRPRDTAVYRTPDDAWGLSVWKNELPDGVASRSLAFYDDFYSALGDTLKEIERRFGRFVVFDLHSYNHRRSGPDGPPADPEGNPQVNIGTGSLNRELWGGVADRFIADLRSFDFPGGALDVRENVKFLGRAMPWYVHGKFPETGCALAVEFKKFFMDEWSGERDPVLFDAIGDALRSTVPGVLEELDKL